MLVVCALIFVEPRSKSRRGRMVAFGWDVNERKAVNGWIWVVW